MPDLLASTSLLSLTPAIPARAPWIAGPAAADFMAVLGELVLPPGAKPQGGKGQALAGDGKDLPVEGDLAADDEDGGGAVIAWLPAGAAPAPLPVEPVALPDTRSVAAPAATPDAWTVPAPAAQATAPRAEAAPVQFDAVAVVETAAAIPTPVEGAPVIPAEGDAAPAEMPPVPIEPQIKAEAPARERPARPAPAPLVTPQPVVPNAPAAQTAAQVFAAAISASFDSPLAPAPRLGDASLVQNQAAAAAEQLRTAVQAVTGAEQPPLDLGRDDWTGKMVDRIAALRDAAEAADTRIRLAPENLGAVDVSIRREGERLHVHFAADNPATRQLLAEAAPRLAELADARGVKLGQTSVDAGAGGQQGTPGRPQPDQPMRPASAAANTEPDHDDRIA